MKKLLITGAIAVTALLSTFPAKADVFAYMTERNNDFGSLDLTTGVFSLLGNSGQTLAGLGVVNATLYGSDYQSSNGNLYAVNPANGMLTRIGASDISYDDFGSTISGLYAVGTNASLYSINAATGSATLVGPTGLSIGGFRSLSTNASALYFANAANLYTLNTSTGAATLLGSTGGPQFGGLVMEGGTLYGGQDVPDVRVDMLNLTTGAATTGPAVSGASSQIYGLAPNPIPEPSTWALALGGLLTLLGLRRVRRRMV